MYAIFYIFRNNYIYNYISLCIYENSLQIQWSHSIMLEKEWKKMKLVYPSVRMSLLRICKSGYHVPT